MLKLHRKDNNYLLINNKYAFIIRKYFVLCDRVSFNCQLSGEIFCISEHAAPK